jgi:hypothetical protein
VGAQQDAGYSFAFYANWGYCPTNFEYKPTATAYGAIGARYNFWRGLSVCADLNSYYFKKVTDFNDAVANYYTQVAGADVYLLYEFVPIKTTFIGLGAGVNGGVFRGRMYTHDQSFYETTGRWDNFILNQPVRNWKLLINFRKILTDKFDLQAGLAYNYFESYYLDMHVSTHMDTFFTGYVGVIYKLDGNDGHQVEGAWRNSKNITCPGLRY